MSFHLPPLLRTRVPAWGLALALGGLATGCATLHEKLPAGPVVEGAQLAPFAATQTSGVTYTSVPRVPFPVLPLQVWGAYYSLDLVLVTKDTGWDMHEYARLQAADGETLWVAKDADADRVQTIVADIADLDAYEAHIPIPRQPGAVEVEDRSHDDEVDLTLRYENTRGQQVEVEFWGRMPDGPPGRRNGNTMGHSAQVVAAVLDLERMGTDTRATVRMDGREVRLARVLGLVPERYLLAQAQGGVAVTDFVVGPAKAGFTLTRPGPDAVDPTTGAPGWPTSATEQWVAVTTGDRTTASHTQGLGSLTYRFDSGELVSASAHQADRDVAVLNMRLDRALPDLRRTFDGVATSRFVFDINGQHGHGVGRIEAEWTDADTVAVRFRPEAPHWLADRPMDGTLRYGADGTVHVEMWRVAPE